jgi:hypothetical protein
MGIIVNFTARTVEGFIPPVIPPPVGGFPVKIAAFNEVTIAFGGSNFLGWTISGSIDRVTGDVEAYSSFYSQKTNTTVSSTYYSLKCGPAQRMF